MTTLHATINALASKLAHELLASLRNASLDQIIAETAAGHVARRGPGRPPKTQPTKVHAATTTVKRGRKRIRRSAEDIAKTADKVVSALKSHKSGLRSEQLQKILHLAKKDITGPIALALKSKKITKRGERRATTYFAGHAPGGAPKAKRAKKSKAKKTNAKKAHAKKPATKRRSRKTAKAKTVAPAAAATTPSV